MSSLQAADGRDANPTIVWEILIGRRKVRSYGILQINTVHLRRSPLTPLKKGSRGWDKKPLKVPLFKGDLGGSPGHK